MIRGVGVDIVSLNRVERALSRWGERFVARLLTPEERSQCPRRPRRMIEYVAGRLAAKEAVFKAVGGGLSWKDVEVLAGSGGRPVARLREGLRVPGTVLVSITHDGWAAVACAVLVEGDGRG